MEVEGEVPLRWRREGAEDLESCPCVPDTISPGWVRDFSKNLERATWRGPTGIASIFRREHVLEILSRATVMLAKEPTLVEVRPPAETSVVVVGDTHGQYHDILRMFAVAGEPSDDCHYIFNGDFVDRGAWGLEVLLVFLAWKLAIPGRVTLLRGNHETTTCTTMYGFKVELDRNFGTKLARPVYQMCKKAFSHLPLAARVHGKTLILHGGLFRKPNTAQSKNKRKRFHPSKGNCQLGSLEDLQKANKGGLDPNGKGSTLVATDVLWSDPVLTEGLQLNDQRGIGAVFGPDITGKFLRENGLKLILRSHEGPDAREGRDDLAGMENGWTLDHETPEGKLCTVFSAPDYPQFQPEEEERINNKAAVAVLRAPTWSDPEMVLFEAVLPRPHAEACYDFSEIPGSDEEMEIAGDHSEVSQVSLPESTGNMHEAEIGSNQVTSPQTAKFKQTLVRPSEAQNGTHPPEATGQTSVLAEKSDGTGNANSGGILIKHDFGQAPDLDEPPTSEFRRSRRLSLNSLAKERQKPKDSVPVPKAKKPRQARKSGAKAITQEVDAQKFDVPSHLPQSTEITQPSIQETPICIELERVQEIDESSLANNSEPGQGPSQKETQNTDIHEDQPRIAEVEVNENSPAQLQQIEPHEIREATDLPDQNIEDNNVRATEIEQPLENGDIVSCVVPSLQDDLEARQGEDLEEKPKAKVYDPYEFPENSFELRTTGGGHQEKRTPDSVKPIYQIANPGRELEQAAAHTLRNIGGLQNLSDTPEPAYLSNVQSQSQDFDLQPSALKDLAGSSTPELTPSVLQKIPLPGKENKINEEQIEIRSENGSIQPLENTDKLEKDLPSTIGQENVKTQIVKGGKIKVPWR